MLSGYVELSKLVMLPDLAILDIRFCSLTSTNETLGSAYLEIDIR